MSVKTMFVCVGLVAAGGFVAHLGHRKADNERFEGSLEEAYHFVPNPFSVRVAALGYHTMFADLMWTRSVLLFADSVQDVESSSHQLLYGMLRTVSVLDPHWRSPHFYGGGMLRVNGDIDGSNDIYARGMEGLPEDPFFPFSLAMNAYLYQEDVVTAAHYLNLAADLPKAPKWYRAAAGGFLDKQGQTLTALRYLQDQIKSNDDPESQQSLIQKYNRVLHDFLSDELTQLAKAFEGEFGNAPPTPQALEQVAHLAKPIVMREGRLPVDPHGGSWIINPAGTVISNVQEAKNRKRDQGAEVAQLSQVEQPAALP